MPGNLARGWQPSNERGGAPGLFRCADTRIQTHLSLAELS
jgi:hypothetical protein